MKKIAYAPANALTSVISSHEYTYQPGGNITTWKKNNGLTDTITTYGYDAADQLLTALTAATATPSVTTETFGYSYDKAANRQSEQRDTVMAGFTFNNLNQVLSRNSGGGILVRGNTDEPAQVTVNGKSVTPAADNTFETVVPGTNGANTIAVTAKDFSPSQNTQTKSWSATMSAGATATYTYDGNGNMTGDGSRTFQWDAKNRLTRIAYAGTNASTEMTYDGLDRRVSIVEKDRAGTVVSSKAFVWNGLSIADQRIGNTVSKQYFSEGWRDASAGTNYFYERDHLGSVREVVNASSSVMTRYRYDAYGRVMKLSGTVESDFQYTGHYAHSPSGLFLAPFRAYDAELGRWISRYPIGEAGGDNLYGYVLNNPINFWDPLGLIEGSPNNIAKRKAINDIAKKYDGSTDWAKNAAKGPMKQGTYKCSQFVFDVTREAGARLPLIGGGFPLAGALADPSRNLKDWRVLGPGEAPQPGDVGAYELTGGGSEYTGHTGINTDVGDISAHDNRIGPPDSQFSGNRNTTWRRYTGE